MRYKMKSNSLDLSLTKQKAEMDHDLNRLNSEYQMTYEYACTKKQDIDIQQAKDRVIELRLLISKLGHVKFGRTKKNMLN